ncbi:unnamed protein product [Rhodiola kirilowii]
MATQKWRSLINLMRVYHAYMGVCPKELSLQHEQCFKHVSSFL